MLSLRFGIVKTLFSKASPNYAPSKWNTQHFPKHFQRFHTCASPQMAGHNKWSKIRHHKAEQDLKRTRMFSKLVREITSATRLGGDDLNSNIRLRFAIEAAKKANVPKANIEAAIKSGLNTKDGVNFENTTYEGYGPGGSAFIIGCLTDNRNRTAATIRNIFTSNNASLSGPGQVSWMFESKGMITVKPSTGDDILKLLDRVTELSIEAGADDVLKKAIAWAGNEGDSDEDNTNNFNGNIAENANSSAGKEEIVVTCEPQKVHEIKDFLESNSISCDTCRLVMQSKQMLSVKRDSELGDTIYSFISQLEDHDDVQTIFNNIEWE